MSDFLFMTSFIGLVFTLLVSDWSAQSLTYCLLIHEDDLQKSVTYAREGGSEVNPPPPIDDWKRNESLSFWNDPLFSYRDCRNCYHGFLCYPTCLHNFEKLLLWCNNTGSQTFLVRCSWINDWLKRQTGTRSMGTVKAGVVLWWHKAIVLNGCGWTFWTRQRFSTEGILGRE